MSEAAQILQSGGRRILVVEDDRDQWRLVERAAHALDSALELDWVCDDATAVDRLSRERYDLVLVDYMLKDSENGFSLRRTCEALQPEATFAMMSSLPLRPPAGEDCPFLQKPFTPDQCRDFLTDTLA